MIHNLKQYYYKQQGLLAKWLLLVNSFRKKQGLVNVGYFLETKKSQKSYLSLQKHGVSMFSLNIKEFLRCEN